MNIYSCVDSDNINKIFVLFYSIFKNTKHFDKLNFYIITDNNIKEKIPDFLENKLNIKIINFTNEWKEILNQFNKHFYDRSSWCQSDLNFARFFFFTLFPDIDRVIYLDWDMIVQEDIYKLIKFYNNDNPIVCKLYNKWNIRQNIINEKLKIDETLIKNIEIDFNVKDLMNKDSFNSGFYIVSKKHFEMKLLSTLINKLINIQSEYKVFKFGTQVIMNMLFNSNLEKNIFIDYRWNTNKISEKSYIIHWCGHKKPWDSHDTIWYNYFNELYFTKNNDVNIKKINRNLLVKLI
jgi:lipopolysaccharide biosynthesis glycosyltransferase